ncbi:Cathepsin L [Oopsacas minuta]|uniref:Cathepsin L n=1 Tax=Oopsacas minuta TaxID=111878 RepID=A0AAV7JJZ9_9METZ|nr:Cathepsin L [Oopsacas minuta]
MGTWNGFTICFVISIVSAYITLNVETGFVTEFDSKWNDWKYEQNKEYKSKEEELARKIIFIENLLYIDSFNKEDHSFTLGLNQFADLTNSEYREQYLSPIKDSEPRSTNGTLQIFDSIIPSIDWRTKGAVGAIKNQYNCKCGWAFSATAALEGQNAIKTGGFEVLSEQQLLDCSQGYGNNGCYGGSVYNSYRYWQYYREERQSAYPYEAKVGSCRYDPGKGIVDPINYFTFLSRGCCTCVMYALYYNGPISVGIDASQPSFQFYRDGLYTDNNCNRYNLNHAVLISAYYQPEDYYWVKNSYGSSWGIDGNFKIKPLTNMCGICQQGSYPA